MLSEKMQKTLNNQVNAEMYSSYLYLSMSAYFHSVSLGGFANWMRIQAQEELVHAIKIFDYINERGGRATLGAIDEPIAGWESAVAAFENVYAHEQKVTELINDLVTLATELNDHATVSFLQWFVNEQVEEEASADDVLQKLKLIGDSGQGVYLMDREMGTRVFTPPATSEGGN